MATSGKAIFSEWVAGHLRFKRASTGITLFSINGSGRINHALVTRVDIDAQNGTLTAANVRTGFIVHTTVTGAGTITCPTGVALEAEFPDMTVGDCVEMYYLNDGTQTATLTGAAGTTALSAQTIATLQGRTFVFRKTATDAFDVFGR